MEHHRSCTASGREVSEGGSRSHRQSSGPPTRPIETHMFLRPRSRRRSRQSDLIALLRAAGPHPVVERFPDGAVIVFDTDFRYVCAGGQGLATVGLTRETIEGKTIYEVFPPEVVTYLERSYRRVLEGQKATVDIPFGDRTYHHRVAPLFGPDGEEIIGGLGFALDLSKDRQNQLALRQSEARLLEESRRLRDAEAIGHSGSWEWDLSTNLVSSTDGLYTLHGLVPTRALNTYRQFSSRVHPDDQESVKASLDQCRESDAPVSFRYRAVRTLNGEYRWFECHASGVFEDGVASRIVGAVADVTERVSAEADAAASDAFQRAFIAASPDFMFVIGAHTGIISYSSRDEHPLGYNIADTLMIGQRAQKMSVHPDDVVSAGSLWSRAREIADGDVLNYRFRAKHIDGRWIWLNMRLVPFSRDDSGAVLELLGVLRDVTDVVEAEVRLSFVAMHDQLTGLPNRALLLDRLDKALARSIRDGREIAVLFCDLDGFKRVNDSYGHGAGDAVLIEVAERLRRSVREGDTVARVGGDEFVLVLEPWNRPEREAASTEEIRRADRELAAGVADRVVQALRAPIEVAGGSHDITVSVGLSYPTQLAGERSSPLLANDVLDDADAAMYRAKRLGKDRFELIA